MFILLSLIRQGLLATAALLSKCKVSAQEAPNDSILYEKWL